MENSRAWLKYANFVVLHRVRLILWSFVFGCAAISHVAQISVFGVPAGWDAVVVLILQATIAASLLLLRLDRYPGNILIVCLFLVLTGWSFVSLVMGRSSCGCFGIVLVDPAVTAAVAFVGACASVAWLVLSIDPKYLPAPSTYLALNFVALAEIFTIVAFIGYLTISHASALDASRIAAREVDPKQWINRPVAMAFDLKSSCWPEIEKGEWLLVVVRPACSKCHELLQKVDGWWNSEHKRPGRRLYNGILVAVIGDSEIEEWERTTIYRGLPHCQLSEMDYPGMETPVIIHVGGGRIISVRRSF